VILPERYSAGHYQIDLSAVCKCWCIFYRKFSVVPIFFVFFRFFSFFSFFRFFRFFLFVSKQLVSEYPPKQLKREFIWVFVRQFRVVSFCFCFLRNSSVCFGCFDIGSKYRNKPKIFAYGFTKQTETNAKQILFRFVSVRTEIYFCLFRGHPTLYSRGFQCFNLIEIKRRMIDTGKK
jgi:hypothetical protein